MYDIRSVDVSVCMYVVHHYACMACVLDRTGLRNGHVLFRACEQRNEYACLYILPHRNRVGLFGLIFGLSFLS